MSIFRRLRGAVVNGMVWGAAWFGLTVACFAAVRITGIALRHVSVGDGIFIAARVGFMGGIAGAAFSVFISLFYRGRRLSGISPARFGLGGGIVAGLFVPGLMIAGNLLSGDAVPSLRELLGTGMATALFGGVAAGASLWLAQRAGTRSIGGPDQHAHLHAGAAPLGDVTRRAHVRARP